jgi:hypothetical protein
MSPFLAQELADCTDEQLQEIYMVVKSIRESRMIMWEGNENGRHVEAHADGKGQLRTVVVEQGGKRVTIGHIDTVHSE